MDLTILISLTLVLGLVIVFSLSVLSSYRAGEAGSKLASIRSAMQSTQKGASNLPPPKAQFPVLPRDLQLPSPYKPTPCRCEPDPAATNVLNTARAPLDAYVTQLLDLVDYRVWNTTDPGPQVDQVIASALNASADAGALAGTMNTQGLIERMTRWHVPTVIVALRVDAGLLKPTTLTWLSQMVEEHRKAFMARDNNLRSWCILDMAVTGLLTGNAQMLADAAAAWDETCMLVLTDTGPIASETARAAKSAEYHDYFAGPFVISAFLLGKTHPRMHSLVNHVLTLKLKTPSHWLYVYDKVFGPGAVQNLAQYTSQLATIKSAPKNRTRFGGSVHYLAP